MITGDRSLGLSNSNALVSNPDAFVPSCPYLGI